MTIIINILQEVPMMIDLLTTYLFFMVCTKICVLNLLLMLMFAGTKHDAVLHPWSVICGANWWRRWQTERKGLQRVRTATQI